MLTCLQNDLPMRIVLIAPPYPLEEAPSPPMGICCIAAVCEKAGHEVVILDYIVSRYTAEKLRTELDRFQPHVVGTNSVTMNFDSATAILRDVKAHNPSIPTLMGGPHVSFDHYNVLRDNPEVDVVIIGEGEETVVEFLSCAQKKEHWKKIPGLAFRQRGLPVVTTDRPLIQSLDALPFPARHLLPMSRYQALGFPVSITTSRGCPNRCIFCLGRRMVGFRVRFRSIAAVLDEVQDIMSYGISFINIADDLFTANKKRVIEFCRQVQKQNLHFTWSAFARVNTVDRELLEHMQAAGCYAISFGIESGNAEMLKRVQKGITLSQARKAAECCKKAGIRTHASFIVGLPGENRRTMADSQKLATELGIEYGYHMLAPFPGTEVRENIDRYDLEILTDDWRRYNARRAIVKTEALTPEEMDAFVKESCKPITENWEATLLRYQKGTCTAEEKMAAESHYRLELIYKLLSEDILENTFLPAGDHTGDHTRLAESVARSTGTDPSFTKRILADLIQKKYIVPKSSDRQVMWVWTHNNRRSPADGMVS